MIKKSDNSWDAMGAIAKLQHKEINITIEEITITMRSLGAKEETDSFIECQHLWGQAFLFQHKIEVLSRSIIAVNGEKFSKIPADGDDLSDEKRMLNKKRELIGQWRQNLVDELYQKYANMIDDVDKFMEKVRISSETNAISMKQKDSEVNNEKSA